MKNQNIQKSNALPLCMAHAREAGRPDPERFLQRFKGFWTRRSVFRKYFPIFWQCGSVSAFFPRENQFLTEISENVKKTTSPRCVELAIQRNKQNTTRNIWENEGFPENVIGISKGTLLTLSKNESKKCNSIIQKYIQNVHAIIQKISKNAHSIIRK